MSRVLIGSVVSGIAVFLWGFVFWGISPLAYSSLSRTTDDAAAGRALTDHLPQTGTYFIPGQHNPPDVQKSLFEAGPVAVIFFTREGKPMTSGIQMAQALLHSIAISLIVAIALFLLGDSTLGYGNRVRLIAIVGLASALMAPLAHMIWWYFPAGWQLWNALYQAVAWLIMGLVLAYFVRSRVAAV
jgi:hypothetical protein